MGRTAKYDMAALAKEKAELEAQLQKEAAYNALYRKLKRWHVATVVQEEHPAGQYTGRYTENHETVLETVELYAQVVTCGYEGQARLVLTNSNGEFLLTVRIVQTAGWYEIPGYWQKRTMETLDLPTDFLRLDDFIDCFRAKLNRAPADVTPLEVGQPELFAEAV